MLKAVEDPLFAKKVERLLKMAKANGNGSGYTLSGADLAKMLRKLLTQAEKEEARRRLLKAQKIIEAREKKKPSGVCAACWQHCSCPFFYMPLVQKQQQQQQWPPSCRPRAPSDTRHFVLVHALMMIDPIDRGACVRAALCLCGVCHLRSEVAHTHTVTRLSLCHLCLCVCARLREGRS